MSTEDGYWGQLLTIPVDGYLEGSGGPLPFRDIAWVEISVNRIKGGMAGHPLQFINVKDEILAHLRETQVKWELHDSTWSKAGIFEDEPVEVVRIANLYEPILRP